MEACDTQIPCSLRPESPPVLRRKRSQRKKKGKFDLEKLKAYKKKSKQVTSGTVKKSNITKRKRARAHELYDDVEAKFNVMEKAERVFTSLAIETPFFFKCMLPSNVTYSFWLIIPKWFCNMHLPSKDSTITLVDEWGKEHKTTYLVDKHGLSAGWRGFSMSHGLLKGDILIFNLIEPCRFMVHIVRVYARDVVNAALCLMNMDAFGMTTESDLVNQDNKKRKRTKKYADTTVLDAPRKQVKVEEKRDVASTSNQVTRVVGQPETCSDSSCSEVLQGGQITDHAIATAHHYPKKAFLRERHHEGVRCM